MALTAARVQRLLSPRGKLSPGIRDKVLDPTELRLQLDGVLFCTRRAPRDAEACLRSCAMDGAFKRGVTEQG
jgi:hypothetical protein